MMLGAAPTMAELDSQKLRHLNVTTTLTNQYLDGKDHDANDTYSFSDIEFWRSGK
jgi:hypothetical protein